MSDTRQGGVSDTAAAVEVLARSRNRVRILDELVDQHQLHRDALQEASEVSRTTLARNLDALEDAGWIRNAGVTYEITPCGELVATEFLDLLETTRMAKRLQDALQWIPVSEIDIDLRCFRDAGVWVPEPGDPYAMINRHVQLLREMEAGRGVLRVTGLHANEAAHEAIVEHGGSAELVVTRAVAETLTSKSGYAPLVDEMRATGRCDLFVVDEPIPFSLVIVDGCVHIVADADGQPRALVESEAPEVRDWAEERYHEYHDRAEALELRAAG